MEVMASISEDVAIIVVAHDHVRRIP